MPTYNFHNKENNEKWSATMTNKEREILLSDNPQIEQVFWETFPGFVDPTRLGIRKPDSSFRDLLKNIKTKYDSKFTRTTVNDW